MTPALAFRNGRATSWTRERLEGLATPELLNLQANAVRLNEQELAALCAEVIETRPKNGARAGAAARKHSATLVARSRAFSARGVWLPDGSAAWSGVRKSDGTVVIAMWFASVKAVKGACECLLWAPNTGGTRPWSDTPAGLERLAHCRAALEHGRAEGLLVHGEALANRLPEDRARTVLGIEGSRVLVIGVEARSGEYWATWGKKKPVA